MAGPDAEMSPASSGELVGVRRLGPLPVPEGEKVDSIEALIGAFHGESGESVDDVVYGP